MKTFFRRIGRAVGDFFYDISCALSRLKPPSKRPVSGMKTKKRKDMIFYVCMLALPLLQFGLMWVGVNFNSILLSFKEYTDADRNFVWTLKNFADVFQNIFGKDTVLLVSLKNSVFLYLLTTFVTMPTSLIISFYFYKKFAFSRALKIVLFIPSIISSVVTVTCFYFIADRGYPQIMEMLTGVATEGLLVNSETRTPTLILYNIFYSMAGNFLFYSSAMSGIDNSVSEAAQIDGANLVQEFFRITLPNIYPMLSTFLVAGLAGALIGDYGMYAFSKAGGSAIDTMGYYFTRGITLDTTGQTYPHSAALGLVLSAMTCVLVFSARAILNRLDPFRDQHKEVKA